MRVKEKPPQADQRSGRNAQVSDPGSHELLWRTGKSESNRCFSYRDLQKLAARSQAQEPKGGQAYLGKNADNSPHLDTQLANHSSLSKPAIARLT